MPLGGVRTAMLVDPREDWYCCLSSDSRCKSANLYLCVCVEHIWSAIMAA